jgi:hypothetical protein
MPLTAQQKATLVQNILRRARALQRILQTTAMRLAEIAKDDRTQREQKENATTKKKVAAIRSKLRAKRLRENL